MLPEELPNFPDSGLEGDVSHKDFGSCLFLLNLFLLAWHLSSPAQRGKGWKNIVVAHVKLNSAAQRTFWINKIRNIFVHILAESYTKICNFSVCFLQGIWHVTIHLWCLMLMQLHKKQTLLMDDHFCLSSRSLKLLWCLFTSWLSRKSSALTGDRPQCSAGWGLRQQTDLSQEPGCREKLSEFHKGNMDVTCSCLRAFCAASAVRYWTKP